MYTNGCNGGYQFVSSEIFFFFSLLEIRWDSTRGRTGSRIYPSRGMIYHRDVPLKSFLSETCSLQNRVTAPSLPPFSLHSECRCNLVFGANVSALVPQSKWIPNELWTPALGWWKDRFQIRGSEHRYFRAMFANIGIFIPMKFCFFFFYFQFFFRNSGLIWWYRCCYTTRPLRKYLSCPRIVVILFLFFLEISCKYF